SGNWVIGCEGPLQLLKNRAAATGRRPGANQTASNRRPKIVALKCPFSLRAAHYGWCRSDDGLEGASLVDAQQWRAKISRTDDVNRRLDGAPYFRVRHA